jgi:hypothetical protein
MGLMANVLAECITKKNSATGSVIDDWLKRYRTSSASGGCEIVNLVLRVAGSPKDFFTIEQYDDTDSDVSLDGFAKRFKTYFLDPRKKATSDNAAVYEEFWHKLVQKSQNKFVSKSQCSILHDFSDKVIAWLTKLSVYVSGTHGDRQRESVCVCVAEECTHHHLAPVFHNDLFDMLLQLVHCILVKHL